MKMFRALAIATLLLALMGVAGAQTWAPIAHQPTFTVGPVFVLRDGRILAHEEQEWRCNGLALFHSRRHWQLCQWTVE